MKPEYIYESSSNSGRQSSRAVIVLPEIFGITDFIKRITDKVGDEFSMLSFALDHFYAETGKSEVFDYSLMNRNIEIMQSLEPTAFVGLFSKTVDWIVKQHPEVTQIVVIGFCFGGRLSYLAATDTRVSRVISFYGAGAAAPDYYKGMSAVEALVAARMGSQHLAVLSLFGAQDQSIPEGDRNTIAEKLSVGSIEYHTKVYEAGHAFFNDSREDRYNLEASMAAWQDVKQFLQ